MGTYENKVFFLVNIYSSCNIAIKKKMWEDLKMSKKGFGREVWCLMGDFNADKSLSERRGATSQKNRAEINAFSQFIEDMELGDIPVYGRKFTWHKSDGSVMSRLDRFLVSEEWLDIWGNSSQWILNRDFFNHCRIILKTTSSNWGPKSFQFNNCWPKHRGFEEMVKQFWESSEVEGWSAFILKEKLKKTKIFSATAEQRGFWRLRDDDFKARR